MLNAKAIKAYHDWINKKFAEFGESKSQEKSDLEICPLDDSKETLIGVILGPEKTIWESAALTVVIHFMNQNHNAAPICYFWPNIYHPNVSWDHPNPANTGLICLNMLKQNWTPMYSLEGILIAIRNLLIEPNCDSPFNSKAAECYLKNKTLYSEMVSSELKKIETIPFETRLKEIGKLIESLKKKPAW